MLRHHARATYFPRVTIPGPARGEGTPYDRAFYADQVDGSERSARVVLPLVFGPLSPRSVVDIGCGQGAWLAAAAALGATELLGIDGPWVDRERLRHPAIRFVPADLAAGDDVAIDRHDLCLSVEVAEHLPPSRADALVQALCGASDAVLFSAAVPHQGGTDHVNEQRASYWAARFANHGYECLDIIRGTVWDDARVEWWYRQNLLVFARRGSVALARLTAAPATRAPLDLVHPEAFESKMAYLLPRGDGASGDAAKRGRGGVLRAAKARLVMAFTAGLVAGLAVGLAAAWTLARTSGAPLP